MRKSTIFLSLVGLVFSFAAMATEKLNLKSFNQEHYEITELSEAFLEGKELPENKGRAPASIDDKEENDEKKKSWFRFPSFLFPI